MVTSNLDTKTTAVCAMARGPCIYLEVTLKTNRQRECQLCFPLQPSPPQQLLPWASPVPCPHLVGLQVDSSQDHNLQAPLDTSVNGY